MVSLERIAQHRLTHILREEIVAWAGQFVKNSSDDGFAHDLKVEIAIHDGQFGNNSSWWIHAPADSFNQLAVTHL